MNQPEAAFDILQGELVRLRAPEPEDAAAGRRWVNDSETRRLLSRTMYPVTRRQEEELYETLLRPGYNGLTFAIETRDGRHIGNISLFEVRPEARIAEVGILIGEKDCWGKGYGTDAMRLVLRFAFEQMNLQRIELETWELNERGYRSYLKLGFKEEGRKREALFRDGRYWDVVLMGCLQEDFTAAEAGPRA